LALDVVATRPSNQLREQDLEDIRALLRANKDTLDMQEIREYFRLFNKEQLLDELQQQL
jgi:hypothetical protein